MSDTYQCQYCKRTDKKVLEMTIWRHSCHSKIMIGTFYAHQDCHIKEISTSGDGNGVKVTA